MIITIDINAAWEKALFIDNEPMNERAAHLAGKTAYYYETEAEKMLEKLICGRDKSYVASQGANQSFTFYSEHGAFRVIHLSVWSNADTLEAALSDIAHFQDAVESEGWKWADTVGGLAGRLCREYAQTKQLEPRWREMSHNAIHQGPMVHCRGGATNVIAWDREKAFLRALYEPMPIGGWIAVKPQSVNAIRGMKGIIRATVSVEPSLYDGKIPPLPVRIAGYTTYPTGKIRGTWTLDMFWDAVDSGYQIDTVHELAVCRALPVHASAADRISEVKDKQLRKMLYTRYWGRLASLGGYEGYRDKRHDNPRRLIGSNLNWYYMGRSPAGYDCPPDYRPDHAAFISSANHLVMNKALRQYSANTVIATHVDCIWTDDMTTPPYESFREKHRGECRFYGVGCYRVGDNLAAQGYKGELTRERLETWGNALHETDGIYRQWYDGKPNKNRYATSNPVVHKEAIAALEPVRNNPDIYWNGWTSKGWKHERTNEKSDIGESEKSAY